MKDKVTAAKTDGDTMTITGKAQKWSLGLHTDTVVSFDVALEGFGATTTTLSTAPDPGNGHGRAVAELEWFGVGASGAPYRNNVVAGNQDLITLNAVSTGSYDVAIVEGVLADPSHAVAAAGASRCQIVIAMPIALTGAELDEVLGFTDDSKDIFS